MKAFRIINLISFILLAIGGLAWLTMGLFNVNLVTSIVFGNAIAARVIYSLVGLATLWLLFAASYTGHIGFPWNKEERR
jgi:uncharacterized membrane protein YuzA (DUF378 family)